MSDEAEKVEKVEKAEKVRSIALLQLEVSAGDILRGASPLVAIAQENWPLGQKLSYRVGKLAAVVSKAAERIQRARQAELKKYAVLDEGGMIETYENGNAKFPPGGFQRYQQWLEETADVEMFTLEGVGPFKASEIPKDALKDVKAVAPLGVLSEIPAFFIEDVKLF
jgi:hypothetical protein